MDDQRFDKLTRILAGGASRRQARRALGASALGALVFRARVPGAEAQQIGEPGGAVTCASNRDCVDSDGDPCTGARCEAGGCVFFIVACAPGFVCCNNGQCCPAGCRSDADCADTDGNPCTSSRCENGECVVFTVACGNGGCCPTGCGSDADCADGVCCGGACIATCAQGQVLDPSCRCVTTDPDGARGGDEGGDGDGEEDAGGASSEDDMNGNPVPDAGAVSHLPNTGTGRTVETPGGAWLKPTGLIGAVAALVVGRWRHAIEEWRPSR